jgi:hypothetical protein
MYKFFSTILSVALLSIPVSAIAFGQSDVPFDMAERGMSLTVSPEGCVVNVTTAQITAIAMTDRSRFVYTQVGNSVYIKPIQRQEFEGVVSMGDGSTTLRIWTGNKILRFKIRYASSGSKDINIVEGIRTQVVALPKTPKIAILPSPPTPSSEPITPVATEPTVVAQPVAVQTFPLLSPIPQPILQAMPEALHKTPPPPKLAQKKFKRLPTKHPKKIALVKPPVKADPVKTETSPLPSQQSKVKHPAIALLKGLNAARINKTVKYQSTDWRRVQDAIMMLRQGKSLDVAVIRSGASKKLVDKLLKLGGADA